MRCGHTRCTTDLQIDRGLTRVGGDAQGRHAPGARCVTQYTFNDHELARLERQSGPLRDQPVAGLCVVQGLHSQLFALTDATPARPLQRAGNDLFSAQFYIDIGHFLFSLLVLGTMLAEVDVASQTVG